MKTYNIGLLSCDDAILRSGYQSMRVTYKRLLDRHMDIERETEIEFRCLREGLDPRILYDEHTTVTHLRQHPRYNRHDSSFLRSSLEHARNASVERKRMDIEQYEAMMKKSDDALRTEIQQALEDRKRTKPLQLISKSAAIAAARDPHYLRIDQRYTHHDAMRGLYGAWNAMREDNLVERFATMHDARGHRRDRLIELATSMIEKYA